MSLQETYDSLKCILEDDETFNQVVDTVFASMDRNKDGNLDMKELLEFITYACSEMGHKDPPSHDQVVHVFKHLDLNSDQMVSKDELEVFLRHLFNEQLKHTEEKLKKVKPGVKY